MERYNDDKTQWEVIAVGPCVNHVRPGDLVFAPLYHDHITLDDGTKIAKESEVQMIFNRSS